MLGRSVPPMNPPINSELAVAPDTHLFVPTRYHTLTVPRLDSGAVLATNDPARGRLMAHLTAEGFARSKAGSLDLFLQKHASGAAAAIVQGKACPPDLHAAMLELVEKHGLYLGYRGQRPEHLTAVYLLSSGLLGVRLFEERPGANPLEHGYEESYF